MYMIMDVKLGHIQLTYRNIKRYLAILRKYKLQNTYNQPWFEQTVICHWLWMLSNLGNN